MKGSGLVHPPERSADERPPLWVWGIVALCIGALAWLGVLRGAEAPPAGPLSEGESPASAPGSTASLRLIPAETLDTPVRIEARVGDAPIATIEDAALPHSLDLPRGTEVLVLVDVPGRARFARRIRVDEDAELRVPLGPGASLAGVVIDDLGEPIEGAQVTIEREDGALPPWIGRSDEEGRFAFDTLHAGAHALRVAAVGHGSVARSGVEPDGESLRITLDRVGSIAGRVQDESGQPQPGATVVIAGSGLWPALQVESDAEGRFVADGVPPGIYEIRARHEALVAEPRRGLEVSPDTRAFLTFTLRPGAVLTGIVRDADTGDPVSGAEITAAAEALDAAPRAAVSRDDGTFRLAGLRQVVHRINVFAEGYVPVAALEHSPGEPLEVTLIPGGTLSGIVLDADHQPIEGATLEVLGESDDRQPVSMTGQRGFRSAVFASQLDPSGMALPVTQGPIPPIPLLPLAPAAELGLAVPTRPEERQIALTHVTDEEGRFTIHGIPPGHVQVVARAHGHAPATTARLYIAAGSTLDDLELVLAPAGTLLGRVIDGREDGVEGVLVEVISDREPHPRVTFTDETGHFTLDSVVGELTVTARPNGRPAVRTRATVEPAGEAEVLLSLEGELHRLYGRTVDARGFPVGGAQVTIASLRASTPHRTTVFSADDGTFVADGLPSGPWRLDATAPSYAPSTVDVFDDDDEAQVPLARGASVSGTVLDDFSGDGVGATVTLVRDDLPPERLRARADGEGAWSIPRARAATWTVRFEADGYLAAERTVTVTDRGRGPEDVALDPVRLTPGGRAEGAVVDALGHVIARARVRAGERSTRTDAQGRFALDGLPGGHVDLVASHPAAGTSDPVDVRILTGRETPGVVLHLPRRFDASSAGALEGRRRGVAIEVGWADGAPVIERVIEDSHAERAGLRPGDALIAIDGEVPDSADEARRLLRGAASLGAIIHMQRGAREATLFVPREVWLPD